jgi:hypothetical protein
MSSTFVSARLDRGSTKARFHNKWNGGVVQAHARGMEPAAKPGRTVEPIGVADIRKRTKIIHIRG